MEARNNLQARLDAIAQKCGIKLDQNDLQLLMYFDEAHCLQVHKTLHEENRLRIKRSACMALCSVVNEFRSQDVMTLFLSTSFSLAQFSLVHRLVESWPGEGRRLPAALG